jgi:hypothetical protein
MEGYMGKTRYVHIKNGHTYLNLSDCNIDTIDDLEKLGFYLKYWVPIELGYCIPEPKYLYARNINLSHNQLNTPEKLTLLATILEGKPLASLNLSDNDISDPQAILALRHIKTAHLDLSSNKINTPKAIAALRVVLLKGKVTSLNLSQNDIYDMAVLENLLQGTNVRRINLGGNAIYYKKDIEALERIVKNTKVTSIDLRLSYINDPRAIAALVQLVENNPQLTEIKLEVKYQALEKALQANAAKIEKNLPAAEGSNLQRDTKPVRKATLDKLDKAEELREKDYKLPHTNYVDKIATVNRIATTKAEKAPRNNFSCAQFSQKISDSRQLAAAR